jgi:flagellar biosynthetic protein FliR
MISLSEEVIVQWLSPILWPFFRILAVFSVAPVFSSKSIPVRTRIGFAFFIAFAVQASLPDMAVVSVNSTRAVGVALQQVLIGLTIGFMVRLIFAAFELAGEVVGFQMGLNFASFFDPAMNAQSSAIGRFFSQITLLLFIVANGHVVLILVFVKSFSIFPVGEPSLSAIAQLQIFRYGGDLFSSAFWISLPVVAMLMFVNLSLGVISRVAPQLNIFAIGFPITLVVGIAGVALTLPMLEQPFASLIEKVVSVFGG